ncbi:FAD-dependent oxidoreductase [Trinickia sp. LjRoot230]|uniref:FAD-dependent monooxygenase n=1 Tax=Trinickia sp. LjRoot230 TaxID=3342288 RepID=UPI003ECFB7B2
MSAAVSNEQPVLIVGAGPTGLAAAMSLARARVAVRLIDRAPRPARSSRAIGIQARTLELFEQHRVVEPFLAHGHRLRAVSLFSNGHRLARLDFDPLQTRYPYLLCLDQTVTERILTEHLATFGVEPERGVELVRLTQGASRVEVDLRHADGREETIHTSFVVAADGAHSTVRHLLGLSFAGKTFEQTFMLADLRIDSDLPDDEFHLFASGDGLAAILSMGDGRHRFIADHPSPVDGEQAPQRDASSAVDNAQASDETPLDALPDPPLALFRQVAEQRIHRRLTLSGLEWSSYFRLNSRMVERLRVQRVFLAGDAAHVHSPAGAQGMNTGMQEAFNLGWKLARALAGRGPEQLLDSYQRERHPIERDVLRQTSFITQLAEAERGPLKLLRERAMPMLAAFGPLRDAARLMVSELSIQYRRSPLTLERVLDGGPRAGERAPDALVRVIDGPLGRAPGTGCIFDLHDPAFFSLFLLVGFPSDSDAGLDPTGVLTASSVASDPQLDQLASTIEATLRGAVRIWRVTDAMDGKRASLTQAYGRTRPAFYLVRPDGYICARGRPVSDASALARHCETWFAGTREHG